MPSLKGKSRNLVFKRVKIKALAFLPFHMHTSHLSHHPHRLKTLPYLQLSCLNSRSRCKPNHTRHREGVDVQLVYSSFNSQSSRSHSCYRPRLQRDLCLYTVFPEFSDIIWLVPCSFHSYRLAFNFSGHTISVISLLFRFQNDFFWGGGVSFPFLFFEFWQLQNCFIILRCCRRMCAHISIFLHLIHVPLSMRVSL